jgi:hypothetical protein
LHVIPVPEFQAGRRFALLIGTSAYADERLGQLSSPVWDVKHLGSVLADPQLGAFAVTELVEATAQQMRTAVELFLRERRHEDLVVVYLSGHGVLDRHNELYFAAADTDRDLLASTGIEADWLRGRLRRCQARQQVLILDCCHAGAYPGTKGGPQLPLGKLADEARGRLVLHAARASEPAFGAGEGENGDQSGSVYTEVLVEGLRGGEADLDRDGYVAVTELHAFAEMKLRERGASQTPQLTMGHSEGTIWLSRSPAGRILVPASLPDQILEDLEHPRPGRRIGAIVDLAEWLSDPDPARELAARLRLEEVVARETPVVARAAREHLDSHPSATASDVFATLGRKNVAALIHATSDVVESPNSASAASQQIDRIAWAIRMLDEAEDFAVSIDDKPPKARALVEIAKAALSVDPDRAERLKTMAERLAESITDNSRRAVALMGIAKAMAASDPGLARSLFLRAQHALTEGSPFVDSHALVKLTKILATFDADWAEHIVDSLAEDYRADALAGIAKAVAAADPERAERIAAAIYTGLSKVQALAGIAKAVATADPERAERLYARAERIAASMSSSYQKSQALADVAHAVAVIDADRAERIAATIDDKGPQTQALAAVAEALAPFDPDRAGRIAVSLDDMFWEIPTLTRFTQRLAKSDHNRAELFVEAIEVKSRKAPALAGLAVGMAESYPDLAEGVAARIDDSFLKAQALAWIAGVWLG